MSFWTALSHVPHRIDWIEANGVSLRFLEAGAGGDALVFVHGLGGHLELFLHNIAAHAAQRRVLALDLPGHGKSGKPPRSYEIAEYVADLLGFLDARGLRRVHLAGLALGGWICARAAAAHPDRVSSLTLIAPGGFTARPAVMAKMETLSAAAAAGREGVRARLEWLIKHKHKVTDEFVDVRWQIYSQPDYQEVLPRLMCLQKQDVRERNLLRREELARITVPTLLAWTTADPAGTVEDGRAFATAIPGARFVLFHDSAHMPQFEEPDRFNDLHLRFLESPSLVDPSESRAGTGLLASAEG